MLNAVLWFRSVENSTAFWAANGVLAAGLLLLRPRVAIPFVALCIAINAGFNVGGGLPLQFKPAADGAAEAAGLTTRQGERP